MLYGTLDTSSYIGGNTYSVIVPSLDLDFINTNILDPRITFSRNSTATYVDKDGYLKYSSINSPRFDYDSSNNNPLGLLLEKQSTNLITYSEYFNNSGWVTSNTYVIPNSIVSPDGSLSASSLVSTASNSSGFNTGFINYASSLATVSTNYTFSIYLKQGTSPKSTVDFFYSIPYSGVISTITWSNPPTVVTSVQNNAILVANTFTSVGGGWYRCSLTMQSDANVSSPWANRVYTLDQSANNTIGNSVYIWGAQLEAGSFPTSYIPSNDVFVSRTSTGTYVASNGYIQTAAANTARYSYNPLNLNLAPTLLLENSSNNLIYSSTINPTYWAVYSAPNDFTLTLNAGISPDGTSNATLMIPSANTGYKQTFLSSGFSNGANNTTYTFSVFAKSAGYNNLYIYLNNNGFGGAGGGVVANLATGNIYSVLQYTANVINYSITPYGNSWYRISTTSTSSNVGPYVPTIEIANNTGDFTFAGDGTSGVYLWGAQVEASNSASSFIPTTSSFVSRAADVSTSAQSTRSIDSFQMTGTNFSSWYNQTQGTLFAEVSYNGLYNTSVSTEMNSLLITDSNSDNYYDLRTISPVSPIVGYLDTHVRALSTTVYDGYNYPIILGQIYKRALGISQGNITPVLNGVQDNTKMSNPTLPYNVNILRTAYLQSMYIRNLKYYPKKLSNTEIQTLTSI